MGVSRRPFKGYDRRKELPRGDAKKRRPRPQFASALWRKRFWGGRESRTGTDSGFMGRGEREEKGEPLLTLRAHNARNGGGRGAGFVAKEGVRQSLYVLISKKGGGKLFHSLGRDWKGSKKRVIRD